MNNKLNKKITIDECSLVVKKKNQEAFLKNLLLLEAYVDKKRPIPKAFIKRTLSYIEPVENEFASYRSRIAVIKKEINRFVNRPRVNYLFTYKRIEDSHKVVPTKQSSRLIKDSFVQRYSFEQMIEVVLNLAGDQYVNKEKKQFALKCYNLIKEYTKRDVKVRKQYTHFKIGVLVGFISFHLNYKLSPGLQKRKANNEFPSSRECFAYVADDIKQLRK